MEENKLEISEINKLYGVEDDVDYLYHYTTVDLEGIIIGPAANREEVKESLRIFLDDNNLQNVTIEFSDVPYRS